MFFIFSLSKFLSLTLQRLPALLLTFLPVQLFLSLWWLPALLFIFLSFQLLGGIQPFSSILISVLPFPVYSSDFQLVLSSFSLFSLSFPVYPPPTFSPYIHHSFLPVSLLLFISPSTFRRFLHLSFYPTFLSYDFQPFFSPFHLSYLSLLWLSALLLTFPSILPFSPMTFSPSSHLFTYPTFLSYDFQPFFSPFLLSCLSLLWLSSFSSPFLLSCLSLLWLSSFSSLFLLSCLSLLWLSALLLTFPSILPFSPMTFSPSHLSFLSAFLSHDFHPSLHLSSYPAFLSCDFHPSLHLFSYPAFLSCDFQPFFSPFLLSCLSLLWLSAFLLTFPPILPFSPMTFILLSTFSLILPFSPMTFSPSLHLSSYPAFLSYDFQPFSTFLSIWPSFRSLSTCLIFPPIRRWPRPQSVTLTCLVWSGA